MPDLDKAVKGLELCFDFNTPEYVRCSKCPYNSVPKKTNCQVVMIEDVVALLKQQAELLKEQEAVEPKVMEPYRIKSSGRMARRKAWCGACGIGINMNSKFCNHCGRKVKWE